MSEDSETKIPQRLVISHAAESEYAAHRFRPHLQMRDLGVAEATGGAVNIYLTRVSAPFNPAEEPGEHYHLPDFQYFYVLKGWQVMRFEGQGEVTFREGSGWLQARGIRHQVLGHSDDFEVLAVSLPVAFETVAVG